MKTFIGILLIGLLGFLGCSDNDDAKSPFYTFNGQTIPVDPFGIEDTMTPTYGWTPVESATRYHLLVQDSIPQDTTETYIIDEWYTAEEAGCDSEEGLCMVTPDINVDGTYTWKVLACIEDDCGLWSDELEFSYPPPTTPRFTDNGDGTVMDHNTELMWTKNADLFGAKNWWDATSYCWDLDLANHSDWSLPYISELNSLIDLNQLGPALPPDNPFTNVQSGYYWSSTTDLDDTNFAWGAVFGDGVVSLSDKGDDGYMWCVRGDDGRAMPDSYDGGCPDGSCQENAGPYRAYMFEKIRGTFVPIEHFGFNLRSYAHSCKDWKRSVSSLGNQLMVNTGTCKSEKSDVAWIRNEVIGKGFIPISWDSRYTAAAHNIEGMPGSPPGSLNFVIYGDFKPRVLLKNYTCSNVMIGMQTWGLGNNSWWFISNTTDRKCTSPGYRVTLSCTEDATGEPVLLAVDPDSVRRKGVNAFEVYVCE
jgi:hypothetical protein